MMVARRKRNSGQAMAEYALLLASLASATILAFKLLGNTQARLSLSATYSGPTVELGGGAPNNDIK
jgi:Flp pilus assembly pilin Flp